ncbi:hypothetical protein Ait01nite_026030 [Actinoplanes italicus]|uniref:Uncharacterized protein n=1 Tax=Actinoplanes italicus TaxID=113567 RepID=A0A2T0KF83_9ACTN|nr:hypothetical protein [Actinoplanes italicus]PRX22023.1 hypothetical protein CLV67_105200 [Actinoplanes italicus]GIE29558.1 hypothetical protein Ait01nite_026030 [Actinoplanes italicus]
MPKVKINHDDHATFTEAAASAGLSVGEWLAIAGRQHAAACTVVGDRPGVRILHLALDAGTAAYLDREAGRSGTGDRAYLTRFLQDLAAGSTVDPDQLWVDAMTAISFDIASHRQRSYLDQARIDTIVGDTVLIAVPDSYTRDVIEARLRPLLTETLSGLLRRRVQIAVTIDAPDRHRPLPPPQHPAAGRDLDELRRLLDRLSAGRAPRR